MVPDVTDSVTDAVGLVVPYVSLDAAIAPYDSMDADALRSELVARDDYIDNLQIQNQGLKNQLVKIRQSSRITTQKLRRRERALALVIAKQRKEATNFEDLAIVHKKNQTVSAASIVAAGLRMGMANCSAMTFGRVALVHLSRNMVLKAEVTTSALIRRCSRSIHRDMRCSWGTSSAPLPSLAVVPRADGLVDASGSAIVPYLASVAMPDSFHIYLTTFLSDATNSSVWKRKKLNSTMICQTRVKVEAEDKELGEGTPEEWWKQSSESRTSLCDIQAVEDGTGAGQIAMLIKQFKSVGVPTWLDITHAVVNKAAIVKYNPLPSMTFSITISITSPSSLLSL